MCTVLEQRDRHRPAEAVEGAHLGLAVLVVAVFWGVPSASSPPSHVPAAVAAAGVVLVAQVLRWRWPVLATVAAMAATAVGWAVGASNDPMIAAACCFYPFALRLHARRRGGGGGATVLVVVTGGLAATVAGGALVLRVLMSGIAFGLAWLLARAETARVAALAAAAEQTADAERMRVQMSTAREVHDVVGHALTVITAEADVARALPDADEAELRRTLAEIEQRARGALEEVQELVRALRTGSGEEPSSAQAPPDALARVVDAARATGLEVTSRVAWPDAAPDVGRAVVRVVQEAVSNVVRHAVAGRCDVTVVPDGDGLLVRVDDDGCGLPGTPRQGSGLVGMRERVHEVGGTLEVDRRDGGGTRVLARIPLRGAA